MLRPVTIKGLSVQFDARTDNFAAESQSMIAAINEVLAQRFPDVQPQLTLGGRESVETDDIEIGEPHLSDTDA